MAGGCALPSQEMHPMSEVPNPVEILPAAPLRPARDHKRTTVRFTDAEFERIRDESRVSGISIPILLRVSFFKRKKLKLLFDEVDRAFVCTQLRRIGNNVNQIAYKVNCGALEGWYDEFSKVTNAISEMQQMVVAAYGNY